MNNMDKAILEAFPLVATPLAEPLQVRDGAGIRFLASRQGLMREINLPWIRLVHPVAQCANGFRLPYGEVSQSVKVLCSNVPAELIRQFVADARAALPNEVAAALIWNSESDTWRYEMRKSLRANASFVAFEEVRLADDEHLVLDVHSHGLHAAYFSRVDDQDDSGAMKFSAVLGNLDRDTPSSAIRLCMAGLYLQASINASGELEVQW
jgi:PRTRC genetic system protein A